MKFTIEVKNNGWVTAFQLLENPIGTMWPETNRVMKYLHGRLTRYKQDSDPRKPAGSNYIRTFRLRDGQKYQVFGAGHANLGRVYSRGVPYDRYVLDEQRQASIHRGRWYTYQSTVVDEAVEVVNRYTRFWQELFRGNF